MRRSACRSGRGSRRRTAGALAAALSVAALVTLAGCSTAISGTATAATHLAPSQSFAETTQASSTETSSTPTESSAAPTSSTEPIRPMPPMPSISEGSGDSSPTGSDAQTLDGASVDWLTAFCTGFSDVASYAGPDTTGLSNDEIVQKVVHAYDSMSSAAQHAEARLQALPQPTFPGEQRIVPAAIDWFQAVTTVYGHGAETIAGTTFHSLDELSAAIDKVESGMDGANTRFGAAVGEVDPSVTETMRGLPECSVLVNSGG